MHINFDIDINRTYGILQAWIKGGQPNEFPNTTRNTFGPKKCNLDTHLGRGTLFEGKSFEAMAPFRAFKWSHIAAAKVLEGGSYEETIHEKYFYWCIVGDEITNKSAIRVAVLFASKIPIIKIFLTHALHNLPFFSPLCNTKLLVNAIIITHKC